MFKYIKLAVLLTLCIGVNSVVYAQERASTFPQQGIMTFRGLDDTSSPPVVEDGRAADILNIVLDSRGAATKRNGYSLKSTTLDTNDVNDNYEAVTSIYELYLSNGTRDFIATCGNKLFHDNSGTWDDITGFTSYVSGIRVNITEGQNNQFVWTTALDTAIGTNYANTPIQWSGVDTATTINFTGLSTNLTKAKCVIWWKNYLLFGNTVEDGTTHSTRIRWSNVGTIDTWSDDDFVDIATRGGQQLEAFGILYDDLIVFLTDSIYKVSLVGGDELIVVSRVAEGVGCIAKNSVQTVQIGNTEGIIFLSRDHTINFFDGVRVTEISELISNTIDGFSTSRLPYAVSADDHENAHYYLSVTDGTVDYNNLLMDFHYGVGEWSKHDNIRANAMGIANDENNLPQTYFGDYNSFIFQLSDDDLDSDVAGEVGVFDSVDKIDTATASGLIVLYDTSADFSDVTGALVKITGGTGQGTAAVIAASTATGIIVTDTSFTGTTASSYSIGAIDAYYITKWYDFGEPARRKNYGELFFWSTATGDSTLDIYYGTDYDSSITTATVNLSVDGSLWGTAIWGNSTWGGTNTTFTRVPLNVAGRYIKYRFEEDTIDEPMELYGYNTIYWGLDLF